MEGNFLSPLKRIWVNPVLWALSFVGHVTGAQEVGVLCLPPLTDLEWSCVQELIPWKSSQRRSPAEVLGCWLELMAFPKSWWSISFKITEELEIIKISPCHLLVYLHPSVKVTAVSPQKYWQNSGLDFFFPGFCWVLLASGRGRISEFCPVAFKRKKNNVY